MRSGNLVKNNKYEFFATLNNFILSSGRVQKLYDIGEETHSIRVLCVKLQKFEENDLNTRIKHFLEIDNTHGGERSCHASLNSKPTSDMWQKMTGETRSKILRGSLKGKVQRKQY